MRRRSGPHPRAAHGARAAGGRYARGKGIYDIAGFAGEPGTGYRHSATLTFSRRATCKGRRAYTKLVIHYSKPIGGKRSGTFSPWGDC